MQGPPPRKPGQFEVVKQPKGGPKPFTPTMTSRQKQKVSDLIKKLRINYNKLILKKRELKLKGP